jgi:hypothetical protein
MKSKLTAAIILSISLTLAIAATTVAMTPASAKKSQTQTISYCAKFAGQQASFVSCPPCSKTNNAFKETTCTRTTSTSGQVTTNCPAGAESCPVTG